MFLASFPAGPWQANCYVLASGPGQEAVVIDAGVDATAGVDGLLAEHGLTLVGVLATHGHVDHVASAAGLADAHQVPLWIHPADRHLLTDPAAGLGPESKALLGQLGLGAMSEPERLELYGGGDTVHLAGFRFSVVEAPGHTAGSVMLRLAHEGHPQISEIIFSGDVLFAGSVGRTDLPGGDPAVMQVTLAERILALPDTAALLPGHGPQTLMGTERATNPYLIQAARN